MSPTERYHALDALRAFVLLLGVVFHSTLAYILPPTGIWAVGTSEPSQLLWWFIYFAHSFRMAVFFVLAGFFARLIVGKRGVAAFLRDRGTRILLVFAVALYPMKYLVSCLWVDGGLRSGWLQLPPEVAALPVWRLAYEGLLLEHLPDIRLTHLWFLYYLACISALFIAGRALLLRSGGARLQALADRVFARVAGSRLAPAALALLLVPLFAAMPGAGDLDTPDKSLAWNTPVLLFYAVFFTIGWWLHRHATLLDLLARRWPVHLGLGVAMSVGGWLMSRAIIFGAQGPLLYWGVTAGTSLTVALLVPGWIGLFHAVLRTPSPVSRYLADASYWIYVAHLPIVVVLQVWLYAWDSVWIKLLVINAISAAVLFGSYHAFVRRSWVGRWLNGWRPVRAAPAAHLR